MSLIKNRTNPYQRIFIVFLGVLFSIVLLEAGLRFFGFVSSSMQEYRNKTSVYKKGVYRIMCLGESTTAGQYPLFLEKILNQRHIGIKFSVIDKGIVGTNTEAILSELEENLNKYQPNMVIAMMGFNDRYMMYYKDIPESNTKLFQYCRVYRFMRIIYMHILNKLNKKDIFSLDRADSMRKIKLKKTESAAKESFSPSKEPLKRKDTGLNSNIELGELCLQQGKFPEAEESFKKALELNPKADQAYVGLGEVYQSLNKLPEAEKLFKKALQLNPKNGRVYLILGRLYRFDIPIPERYSKAEELFKRAIELSPSNDKIYVELGELYRFNSQGKFFEAEESFKKALELNPKNDKAYIGLGELYIKQGRFAEAEQMLKKILELNPKNDWVYRAFGILYREMNKIELVVEYEKKRDELRLNEYSYSQIAIDDYHKLKGILDKRGIRLVCVQYAMRNLEPLKKIFEGQKGAIFVDNEEIFRNAIKEEGYKEYFTDMFGGDFGHCTQKGNRLLAENIADVILKELKGI